MTSMVKQIPSSTLEAVVKRRRKVRGVDYITRNFVYKISEANNVRDHAHAAGFNAFIVESKTLGGWLVYISTQRSKRWKK